MGRSFDQIEGKYEILAKLSEGGMGAIYKVRHRLLDEIRVIKTMRPHLAGDDDLAARFRHEARAAIRLKHPGIAELYDFTIDAEKTAYIVMEYIGGHTLEHILETSGPPPVSLSLEIARQVLEALAFLHGQGFVHRDISPDNLMVTTDARNELCTKIIDLGIAKALTEDRGLTATGMFLGKIRYASPEQFGGGKSATKVDTRSDLYAFGVVLYELLTGTYPIVGDEQAAILAGHLFHPPRSFDETDPQGRIAEDLRRLVREAMAKKPEDRIASAEHFAERLAAIQPRYPLSQAALDQTLTSPATAATPLAKAGSTQERLDRQFAPNTTPAKAARISSRPKPAAARPSAEIETFLAGAEKLSRLGHLTEAHRQAAAALDLAPGHTGAQALLSSIGESLAEQRLGAARLAFREGDLDQADKWIREALLLHPDDPSIKAENDEIGKAVHEAETRREELAQACSTIAAAIDRRDLTEASVALADIGRRLGRDDPALTVPRMALATARREEAFRQALDTLEAGLAEGDLEQAESALVSARDEIDSTVDDDIDVLPAALHERFESLGRRFERQKADAELAKAVDRLTTELEAWIERGALDAAERALRDARQTWQHTTETLDIDPFRSLEDRLRQVRLETVRSRVRDATRAGQETQAVRLAEALRSRFGPSPEAEDLIRQARRTLAAKRRSQRENRLVARAIESIQKSLEHGDHDTARSRLRKALARRSRHPELLALQARLGRAAIEPQKPSEHGVESDRPTTGDETSTIPTGKVAPRNTDRSPPTLARTGRAAPVDATRPSPVTTPTTPAPTRATRRHRALVPLAVLMLALAMGGSIVLQQVAIPTGQGTIVLDASPWAEVVSIHDAKGQSVPLLPARRHTPTRLHLPTGRYRLTLEHPETPAVRLTVEVQSGTTTHPRLPALANDATTALTFLGRLGIEP